MVGTRPSAVGSREDRVELSLEILYLCSQTPALVDQVPRLGAQLDQIVHSSLVAVMTYSLPGPAWPGLAGLPGPNARLGFGLWFGPASGRHPERRQDQIYSLLVFQRAISRRIHPTLCLSEPFTSVLGPADQLDRLQRPIMTELRINAPGPKPPAPSVPIRIQSCAGTGHRLAGSIQILLSPPALLLGLFQIPLYAGESVPVDQILPGLLNQSSRHRLIRLLRISPASVFLFYLPQLRLRDFKLLAGPSVRRSQLFRVFARLPGTLLTCPSCQIGSPRPAHGVSGNHGRRNGPNRH